MRRAATARRPAEAILLGPRSAVLPVPEQVLHTPSTNRLPALLARLARAVAERLAERGVRAWIVGGAVRDLALGRAVKDVDMASAAPPEVVEAAFERTVPLGRSFGTIVIHLAGHDVEHTTFRAEDGYGDARHPDHVTFGATPEEDAARRDFRCNALYLDPLTDEVRDPTGGLADLAEGRLACVGEAARRFAEDGLRIVRLARFAGQLGLKPTADTMRAASASLAALRGVSRERLRLEFEHSFTRGGFATALGVLAATGALDVVLKGLADAPWLERTQRALEFAPNLPGTALGFALLFDPVREPCGTRARSLARLADWRPSRALLAHVDRTWSLAEEFVREQEPPRSTRFVWMRNEAFVTALDLCTIRARTDNASTARFDAWRDELARTTPVQLAPPPLITSDDLRAHGILPGPEYGVILGAAERLQLDLELETREAALAWLARRVQDGGNTLRKP